MEIEVPASSGDAETDSLVEVKWVGTQLSFSFPALAAQFTGYDSGEPFNLFEALNSAQQAAARAALASISTFTGLTFTESTGGDVPSAVLRFGMTDDTPTAHAYLPIATVDSELGGDVWFRNTGGNYDNPVRGNYAWHTMLHEIGHALGLGHPHESFPPMTAERDLMIYSVMSYRSGEGGFGYPNDEWSFAQTYMQEDIAALQFLYGANFGHNSGDSVYQWNPASGEMSINGVGQDAPGGIKVFQTVWDGGGEDTYDLSNYAVFDSNGTVIDLRPGGFSSLPPQSGHFPLLGGFIAGQVGSIANALLYNGDARSLIENAVGTGAIDTIYGNEAANTLNGGSGDDRIEGFGGDDTLLGGDGSDTLYGHDGNDVMTGENLHGGDGNDTLHGTDGARGFGGNGDDMLTGSNYADELHGEQGADTLHGGAGIDILRGHEGADALYGDASHDQLFGGEDADTLHGGAGFDTIWGDAGDDTLEGGADSDQLIGGAGADVFYYVSATDSLAGQEDWLSDFEHGIDLVDLRALVTSGLTFQEFESGTPNLWTSVSVATPDAVAMVIRIAGSAGEADFVLALPPVSGQTLTGTSGDDTLTGGGGNDTLDGGPGNDQLAGGLGDDTYYVDSPGDVVVEAAGQGYDRVISSVGYELGAGSHVEVLQTADSAGLGVLNLYGNAFANTIYGNAAGNVLSGAGGGDSLLGLDGHDTLYGGDGADAIDGGAGQDVLLGGADSDYLLGGADNDLIDGGTGSDSMVGGTGDDTYFVDSTGDLIVEAASEGFDRVISTGSAELGAGSQVEVMQFADLAGTVALSLYGSDIANTIYGNAGANVLAGLGGADYVVGLGGNDTLYGGEGADALDGGAGQDVLLGGSGGDYLVGGADDDLIQGDAGDDNMFGGTGDDSYYVDSAGDLITEAAGEGFDRVISTGSYELGAASQVEVMQFADLAGTAALYLYGSDIANTLYGNAGGNVLSGGAGADYLVGLGGADTLYGGADVDTIDGGAGSDVLYGGAGADYLVGGADGDYFAFFDALGGGNVDQIADMAMGSDKIALDDAVFTALALGALSAGAFVAGAAAADGDDRVIYHAASGQLWFDADGSGAGAAVLFATVAPGTALTSADFAVF